MLLSKTRLNGIFKNGRKNWSEKIENMQNHVTITNRQNAEILWRYQSLLISTGKGKRKLKRSSNKECCKQCRYVMFKGTMTNWPVQKLTQGTTQKLLQHHDATDIWKTYIFVFFGFLFFLFSFLLIIS